MVGDDADERGFQGDRRRWGEKGQARAAGSSSPATMMRWRAYAVARTVRERRIVRWCAQVLSVACAPPPQA